MLLVHRLPGPAGPGSAGQPAFVPLLWFLRQGLTTEWDELHRCLREACCRDFSEPFRPSTVILKALAISLESVRSRTTADHLHFPLLAEGEHLSAAVHLLGNGHVRSVI